MTVTEQIMVLIATCDKPVHFHVHNTNHFGGCSGVGSASSVLCTFGKSITLDQNATFMIHHSQQTILKQDYEQVTEDILFWVAHTGQDYDTIQLLMSTEYKMKVILCSSDLP